MHKKSMLIPVSVAVLFILGLLLMFNMTPDARYVTSDSPAAPETTSPVVQAGAPLETTPNITEPEPTAPPLPPDTSLPEGKAITAHHAFAYDTSDNRLCFYQGDPDGVVYPASITKLITAYVVQKYMSLDDKVTVGEEITWIDPESSVAELKQGDSVSVRLLIYGLMLPSGNDAAYTLAVACGRMIAEDPGLDRKMAYGLFVDEMNAEARLLGMQNTHFSNPDGNHADDHYTSINDLINLTKAVMDNELIMTCAKTVSLDVTAEFGRALVWKNSNLLLREGDYYTESAVGMKTGSTSAAGACLISLFRKDDGFLMVGVLGSSDNQNRYLDTLTLYQLYC